ncbi:MAG: alpha/beta hydrolase [Bacteroidota bacterium]
MNRKTFRLLAPVLILFSFLTGARAQESLPVPGPEEYIYAERDSVELRAYLFSPVPAPPEPRAAVVVFHGGGWSIGKPAWAFSQARHFAELGMIGVAAEYRLSDQRSVTPLDAMADARAVIRWMRANADSLRIDVDRIGANGWSAGAHLAACAAIFTETDSDFQFSCAPTALVLQSPAVSLDRDGWFRRLLLGRVDPLSVSPDEHVRSGLPPTLVLQGDVDTVNPLEGVERFCRRMVEAGNRCELKVYEGYGHLFTPAGIPDDGWPQPDPEVRADALKRTDAFLQSLGFY